MGSTDTLRSLPAVDRLLRVPELASLASAYSRSAVTGLVRQILAEARASAATAGQPPSEPEIVQQVLKLAHSSWRQWPSTVINATGVVLHTNLGRAPLSAAAAQAAASAASGYTDLEFDLSTGKRGSRYAHTGRLIAQASGAQAGIAVNNNAAGSLLTLSALASGREVIVSRGEAVEIGGGFRVPDVLRQSGATIVEIGTTNRTYARDYESAVTSRTAAILKVHPSNFSVTGFTHVPELAEITAIGRKLNIPVLYDLGSGCLLDTSKYGLAHEPTVQECISSGADVVMFSGDKLLGGPQCGLIAGQAILIKQIEQHPLARAVRTDKMTLAALSATLMSYIKETAEQDIPIWQLISASLESLKARALAWQTGSGVGAVREVKSTIGGGSLPGETLPTFALAVDHPRGGPDAYCARLRANQPPVIARIESETTYLDPRTVLPHEDSAVLAALRAAS